MTTNLNFIERVTQAENLIFNKTKFGLLKDNAREFKSLISGLNLSIDFFIKSYFKNNSYSRIKENNLRNKIIKFIEIANIKTTNAFFYKKNEFKHIVGIECFIILL